LGTDGARISKKLYNQYIKGYSTTHPNNGFDWQDYKTEIDNNRPVLLHIIDPPLGHAMFGVGYQEIGGQQIVELCDTWTMGHGGGTPHTMNWGGWYGGMQHYGVTVMDLGATAQGILVTGQAGNWLYQDTYYAPNQLYIQKHATDMGPFDLEITVLGGIDPINILEEVENLTGITWTDYHFELGYGLGQNFVSSQLTPGDGLSFFAGLENSF